MLTLIDDFEELYIVVQILFFVFLCDVGIELYRILKYETGFYFCTQLGGNL